MDGLREIKFRAWSEGTKEMIQVSRLYLNENTVFYENGNKALNRDQELGFWHKPYILMQYTGLKDKNGVEIYEGDILSGWIGSHWHSGEDKFEEVVKYDEKTASYNFPAIEVRYGDLEVIGNIYENKQLKELINVGITIK